MKLLPHSRSLRHKLNLVLVATTFLALTLAGAGLVAYDLRSQADSIEHDLVVQADIVGLASSAALAFDDAKGAAENLRTLRANTTLTGAALYRADGRPLATFVPEVGGVPPPPRAMATSTRFDGEAVRIARQVMSGNERIGTVYIEALHNLSGRALEHMGVLFAIMAASLAAALALANRMQRGALGPLQDLSAVAQRIKAQGDFSLRATRATDDEVGELVDAFNAMVDELGRRARVLEQANQALRSSEDRYQLAVRGSSAGLWDWDLRTGTMFYSPRLKALLGYSDEEFPDVPGSLQLVVEREHMPAVRAALREHFLHDKPYQVEIPVRLKSGEERWLMIAGTTLRGEDGRPFRMAGSVVDVTERKLAENVLRNSNRAKDEFIATLAHELRNPLAPIRTGLEILKIDRGNGPASQRARETMERQLSHMIRLIDDLLDISRITSGKIRLERQVTALRTSVESALEISRPAIEAGKHQLQVELLDPDIEVEGDATRLAQCVGNLLNNAAKYTPPGGRIRLRMWREVGDGGGGNGGGNGGEAVVEVSDNGVGIPADMLDHVFSMFAQVGKTIDRAQGGLGIGLSLVRSLVGLHGGTVRAASAGPGKGSTFSIRLPCLPAHAATSPVQPVQHTAEAAPGAQRILVVDDNVDAAETLAAVLDMMGHPVRTVHAPAEVKDAALSFAPDAILLDIGLPGMTGYEVAQQLRADARFARTLLIAVTGWGSEADRERAREAGFDHHVTKPVELDALLPLLKGAEEEPA